MKVRNHTIESRQLIGLSHRPSDAFCRNIRSAAPCRTWRWMSDNCSGYFHGDDRTMSNFRQMDRDTSFRFPPSVEESNAPPESASSIRKMTHRLKTRRGKELFALRKQTTEPKFGIVKSVIGFRQFLLRGFNTVRGEWNLLSMSWNIKRMFALKAI
jgi:hypothetical protein